MNKKELDREKLLNDLLISQNNFLKIYDDRNNIIKYKGLEIYNTMQNDIADKINYIILNIKKCNIGE